MRAQTALALGAEKKRQKADTGPTQYGAGLPERAVSPDDEGGPYGSFGRMAKDPNNSKEIDGILDQLAFFRDFNSPTPPA